MTRTLWWEDGELKMIDQRALPERYLVPGFSRYEEVAEAITNMTVRGAPAIGAAGAFGMALAAQASAATDNEGLLNDLARARETLDAARPTAVNLSWATRRVLEYAQGLVANNPAELSPDVVRAGVLAQAMAIADEDVAINRRMGKCGAAVVPAKATAANILHHCNTGSLATVDFGTALGVVRAAVEEGKQVHVWVDETRPRLQGARLTAWELMRDGIPMTLIADNAAGMLMRMGKVDVVLFGADRIAANGDVANKVGSYKLAVLAHENGIPCYSVAPTSTVDLNLADGDLIPIEEREAGEVACFGDCRVAPEGVPVYNPAFDVTPHRYLSGIITEEGICHPPFEESLKRAKEAAEERWRGQPDYRSTKTHEDREG